MKRYTAVLRNLTRIISVDAENATAARCEITRQLGKNPETRKVLNVWRSQGSRVSRNWNDAPPAG